MCELIQTELNPCPDTVRRSNSCSSKIYVDLNEFLVDFYGA